MSKFISKPSAPAASSPVIPHTFDRTRPTKSNLSYMKNYSYFTPARELRNFRLNVFGPLHGRIKHFFRHVEHS